MSTTRRRAEIKAVREEGRAAAMAGRHVQTCPYRDMNQMHWVGGHSEGLEEMVTLAAPPERTPVQVTEAVTDALEQALDDMGAREQL